MRGAHPEHVTHVRDAGRVEAERLVERIRGLPSRKEGARCRARCGPKAGEGVGRRRHERHARREGPAVKAGGYRACAERTENMPSMSVTLDVLKLSGWLNAVANCRVESRAYDAGRSVGRGREDMGQRQRTSRMHGRGPGCEGWGARACAERT